MTLHFLRLRPWLLAVLSAGAVLWVACGAEDRAADQPSATPPPPVEALQARSGSLPLEERLNGVVKARHQVSVRAEISGRVAAVLVDSGARVEPGQVLVRLDDGTLSQQLRQAEAGLRLAEAAERVAQARVEELDAEVSRTRQLAARQLVSELDLETQEAQLAAVQAAVEEAAAQVEAARGAVGLRRAESERAVVRSPLAGRVGQRRVEQGMIVGPNDLLFEVGNLDQVQIEVPLTERMLGYLRPGQPVLVRAGDGEPLAAELSRIPPFLEGGSFSTVGEIDLDNRQAKLSPGMFVTVDVLYGESEQATLVPATVLWDDPRTGAVGVFVVAGLPADAGPELSAAAYEIELRSVEVLARGRSLVGLRGIEAREWVVSTGQHLLAGGEPLAARVRPITWQRVEELQALQREDLLRGFLAKQQRLAQTLGPGIPSLDELAPEPAADSTATDSRQEG